MLRDTRIINPELCRILASMGHSDMLVVADAGYPIPENAWCLDLSITRNFPDLVPVLEIVAGVFIAEKIIYAENVRSHNKPYHRELQRIFDDCDHETLSPEEMLFEIPVKAKAFIRTAGYNPWGNVALVSGPDPDNWFDNPEVRLPEEYQRRREQLRRAKKGG